jgi:hypothetical protein
MQSEIQLKFNEIDSIIKTLEKTFELGHFYKPNY